MSCTQGITADLSPTLFKHACLITSQGFFFPQSVFKRKRYPPAGLALFASSLFKHATRPSKALTAKSYSPIMLSCPVHSYIRKEGAGGVMQTYDVHLISVSGKSVCLL